MTRSRLPSAAAYSSGAHSHSAQYPGEAPSETSLTICTSETRSSARSQLEASMISRSQR